MEKKIIEAELRKDLLERSGETFTFERTDGRLGWEKTIPEGSGYSSYVSDAKDGEDLMKKAYTLASQMITAMDTPWKVRVRLNPGEESGSYTDFRQVAVSTSVFDDEGLTLGQKMDTFLGFAIHEACHLLYSEPVGGSSDKLTRSLENILEDERVEHLCGERTPGLVKFLASAKYHVFDRHREANASAVDSPDGPVRLVNAILSYVRYPKALSSALIGEFGQVLLRVREILTPFPSTAEEVSRAAQAIAALIRSEAGKTAVPSPEGRRGEDSGKKDEPADGKSDGKSDKGSSLSSSSEGSADAKDREEHAPQGDPLATASSSSSSSEDTEALLSSIADSLSDLSGGSSRSLSDEDVCRTVREDRHLEEICEGLLERGSQRDTYFLRAEVTPSSDVTYEQARQEVLQYIPAIRRALKRNGEELRRNLLGMRSGHFDCNRLADAFQGSQTVFRRQSVVKADKVAVCILLDESGSMVRNGRMPSARRTAVLLNEALSGLPGIDLYIYGHTADVSESGDTRLVIYREHGAGERRALGSACARSNNRDGVAIREVARRVRRFTSEKCLLFVISDGAPAAQGYSGRAAVLDTRKAVSEVTGMGFAPVQIAIQACYDPSSMFEHFVVLENLSSLPKELGRIIRDSILRNASRRTV